MRTCIVATSVMAIAAVGCGSVTEIVVEVHSDLRVPSELDAVRIVVDAEDVGGETQQRTLALGGASTPTLPLRVTVVYRSGPLGPLRIHAIGMRQGEERVRRSAALSFTRGASILLRLDLGRRCTELAKTCEPGATCVNGRCTPLPAIDGGTAPDGGGCQRTPDCSRGGCTCEPDCSCTFLCDPGEDCTGNRCDEGATCTVDAREASNFDLECRQGATCVVDARDASNVREVSCRDGSTCSVDCTGASNCVLACDMGSHCLLDCSDASEDNCFIRGCVDDVEECGSGVLACQHACP